MKALVSRVARQQQKSYGEVVADAYFYHELPLTEVRRKDIVWGMMSHDVKDERVIDYCLDVIAHKCKTLQEALEEHT